MERKNSIPPVVYINFALVFVLLFAIFFPEIRSAVTKLFSSPKPISASKQSQAIQIQSSFRNVYREAQQFVVSIRTKKTEMIFHPYAFGESREDRISSIGSGFIIDERGFVVTNYHVIKNAEIIEIIMSDGRIFPARYVGSHERADIALLKIPSEDKFIPAFLGNSDEIEVGDWAIAVGSPYGLEKTFTVGVVSAKSREDLDETGQTHIQTDTAINPGSSGGPLLNIYGEVVGINRMIRSSSGASAGIGFAIPINYAKRVLRQIEQNVGQNIRPATLGVMATTPLPDHRKSLGIPNDAVGVLVYDIEPNSAAEKGGLRRYDFIEGANGLSVRHINDLREQVGLVGLGGVLRLKILRDTQEMELSIPLVEAAYPKGK
ncbi:S1C family serine protease [Leptospira levettii]|uniref:Trypsin-like peptidase domain-containing protein n=1 Tax=Leptospira levettii TaxID=2023178 RepID=A0AAW5V1Z7_9LEPT|nr:trypsin-like peptidase domain-containing protein [Leptospira levettii]MCW7464583.1 trypsin-like peptidase domain-containing protein [Leptospira levettii]MCW7511233.1 trypsin-like peptidase domain-containing protein [Leptospira levettii]MCW7514987.1 trypsin-like peptidase domain-containing protein [Leptospira levettii]TGM93132.1 serine protease [Leptospira levettii]